MTTLVKIMEKKGVSQTDLSKQTGIGRSSLSQYMSGQHEPPIKRKILLAEALDVSVEELFAPEEIEPEMPRIIRISVKDAARIMGMSHETVRKGLQQGVFPWGYAIKTSENQWSYFVNAKKFSDIESVDLGVDGESSQTIQQESDPESKNCVGTDEDVQQHKNSENVKNKRKRRPRSR